MLRTAVRTEREFEDFNLKLEVNVPAGSNSGVYLRGIYEVQVLDSYGKPLHSENMGAIYFDESLYLIDLGVRSIVIIEAMETCVAEEVTQKKAFATGKIAARTNARLSAIIPQAGRGRIVFEELPPVHRRILQPMVCLFSSASNLTPGPSKAKSI